jgi:endonuclease-3
MLEARKWLTSLPGVGPKTASIVLCFSFGMDAVPVDTHVFRVAWRYGLIDQARGENAAHDDLLAAMPKGLAGRFHLALLAHGRAICQARKPRCEVCPLAGDCKWNLKTHGADTL